MQKLLVLIALATFSTVLAVSVLNLEPGPDAPGYWIWRGSDLELIDSSDALMLYQGDYHSDGDVPFLKRGVDPFPLPGHSEIGVLVRLYDIDDADLLADQVSYLVRQWENHDVDINEIQLDYDCPSGQLTEYKLFVDRTRARLDAVGLNIPLSITGLLTWHTDESTALASLAESVTYIAFQLYDSYEPLPNLEAYLVPFEHYQHAYKIGISTSDKFNRLEPPRNDNYQGNLIFLNVAH